MARIHCTEVNLFCPVEATTLGYYPNLGANAFFCAAFGLCAVGTIVIGIWKRTWTFAMVVGAGLILETVGASLLCPNPRCSSCRGNRRS